METIFKDDSTMRLSFRTGERLVWFHFNSIMSKESLRILDMWKLNSGDYATLTNRWEDIPSWFELHPLEVQNSLCYKMREKLNNGYKPSSIMDGPNLWRINSGDTIVWFGKSRPDMKAEDGILSIFKFYSNALLLGESNSTKAIEEALRFGSMKEYSENEIKEVRVAMDKLREKGIPNTYSLKWGLG